MRRALLVMACAAALSGCGGKAAEADPKLCPICRKLDEMEGDGSAKAVRARQELRRDREERIRSVMTYREFTHKDEPAAYECPECDKVHERLVQRRK